MQSSADVLRCDQVTTERAKALVPFGLTERQARFLVTVMLHSGVFVGRQYAAFAGITLSCSTPRASGPGIGVERGRIVEAAGTEG
jgi:hypothetical protein